MFDFAKTAIKGVSINTISNSSFLEFISPLNRSTGEVMKEKVATYKGMKFIVINDMYVNLNGSFHKFHNTGKHNHNDFSISQYVEVLKDLSEKFGINPYLSYIHNLEFGVNIELPFETKTFLDSIISYKGKEFQKEAYNNNGYLLRFESDYYELKIYDKALQYNLNGNLLRYEIKVKKMEYFNSDSRNIGINNFTDLINPNKIKILTEYLLKTFKELLIYDNTININAIDKKFERELLLNGRNPKYWSGFETPRPKTYFRHYNRFRKLVLEYGNNDLQKQVYEMIKDKLKIITNIDYKTNQKIKEYLSGYQLKSVPILTDIKKADTGIKNKVCTHFNQSNIELKGDIFKSQRGVHKNYRIINANWTNEIIELEKYFENITLPTQPVKISQCSTIINISKLLESHFAIVKMNKGNKTYLPYLERLQELKKHLIINQYL